MVLMSDTADTGPIHFTAQQPRRETPRIPGTFQGRLIGDTAVAVSVRDLNTAGCFVDAAGADVPISMAMRLHVDLPSEGRISADAQIVYRLGRQGMALKFVDLDDETRDRITREIGRAIEQARF